jgi:malate dehydrogenase
VSTDEFDHIMMAMETTLDKNGVSYNEPKGTEEEQNDLRTSYSHLRKLVDEVIGFGILPAYEDWNKLNPNIK